MRPACCLQRAGRTVGPTAERDCATSPGAHTYGEEFVRDGGRCQIGAAERECRAGDVHVAGDAELVILAAEREDVDINAQRASASRFSYGGRSAAAS